MRRQREWPVPSPRGTPEAPTRAPQTPKPYEKDRTASAAPARLPIRADSTRSTLAADGHEIRYSPAWVAETNADFIKTAIGRVVLSCALKHHTRRADRDPERWQHASQLVTHALLRDAGFKLPPEAEAWDGLSVEQAYDRLPEPDDGEAPPAPGADDADPSGPPGPGDSENDDHESDPSLESAPDDESDEADDNADDDRDQPDKAQPAPSNEPGNDQADPADDGNDAQPSFDPAGTGEIMDASSADPADGDAQTTPADIDRQEQAWDEAMHQALSLAKAQGNAPGAVEETIADAHRSTFDWRTLLRLYMTDAAASDYSWSVPNRRFIDTGLYLPSIRSEGMSTLAVIIDTSGSVDTDTLAAFWSEIRELASEINPDRILLLQVDAVVQDEQDYAPADLPERIDVKGRWPTTPAGLWQPVRLRNPCAIPAAEPPSRSTPGRHGTSRRSTGSCTPPTRPAPSAPTATASAATR